LWRAVKKLLGTRKAGLEIKQLVWFGHNNAITQLRPLSGLPVPDLMPNGDVEQSFEFEWFSGDVAADVVVDTVAGGVEWTIIQDTLKDKLVEILADHSVDIVVSRSPGLESGVTLKAVISEKALLLL